MAMETIDLFTAALNLQEPWKINKVEFVPDGKNPKKMVLHIYIGFPRGSEFPVPGDSTGRKQTAYDTKESTWRHLNFFQYKTYIHARQPRVMDADGKPKLVSVPWARDGSGFTLLFEGWVVELAKHLPVSVIADMVEEYDTRLWRFIRHYVDEAREKADYSDVTGVGMDETSKKGRNYITVMVDLEHHRVIFVVDKKDASTVDKFVEDFRLHGGNADNISIVTCDMALGFKAGIRKNFPNAHTIIDKFHVIKNCNEDVDRTRKDEAKTNAILKHTKYLWLKNSDNLSEKQSAKKEKLMKKHLKTARAYSMRVELQDIYEESDGHSEAESRLKKLVSWMMHSRLDHMKHFAGMLKDHWEEILNYFDYKYTNAILEGTNSIIQNIKCRARGFRNDEYFKTMIYLVCGQLDLNSVIVTA